MGLEARQPRLAGAAGSKGARAEDGVSWRCCKATSSFECERHGRCGCLLGLNGDIHCSECHGGVLLVGTVQSTAPRLYDLWWLGEAYSMVYGLREHDTITADNEEWCRAEYEGGRDPFRKTTFAEREAWNQRRRQVDG